ncbi:TraR/DksA C4-type zinc finger protein [Cohnella lubricantis]|uniref:TraR/DksA C4-type zinc finger protein n=1 Tax=Cohnella lubricantis TaxID=2163172 RepID=A0A841TD74_9BACL|nr:TraR/DksA C4-type zinc finger protein [Cohnella lubricantis]MBB6677298.1 TraR/DksA C4-type zinc finger protein [Cohnella lubricantis]MBP2116890.1 YteA family regulatory protein [Cohnella lubricantis]
MTLPLTEERLQALRNRLLEDKTDIESRKRQNGHFGLTNSFRESTGELSSNDNHPADGGTEMFERGKDIALEENETFRLARINAALERMDKGTYGLCDTCGKPIPVERLEALPEATRCMEHTPRQQEKEGFPVEESFLHPPFGRTSMDEHEGQNGFDGEDAWQIVESWGTSNSPAMAEGNDMDDYGHMEIEADENDSYVEPLESFLATDITGHDVSIVRNRAYRQYLENHEGDPLLEPDETADDWS